MTLSSGEEAKEILLALRKNPAIKARLKSEVMFNKSTEG